MAVIRRGRVTLDIHDGEFVRLGSPGGAMWNMVNQVTRTATGTAKILSPKRSMAMSASISAGRPVYNAAKLQSTARFSASVPYIWYVLEGTTGPIVATGGKFMKLSQMDVPAGKSAAGYARMVKGQSANDFMTKSLRQSLRTHRLQ